MFQELSQMLHSGLNECFFEFSAIKNILKRLLKPKIFVPLSSAKQAFIQKLKKYTNYGKQQHSTSKARYYSR